MHDLTHAYTLVLVVSIVVVALTLLPVAFLPNKPPPPGRRQTTVARLERYSSNNMMAIRWTVAIGSAAFSSGFTASFSPQHRKPMHQ